jgi:hypothetical protein
MGTRSWAMGTATVVPVTEMPRPAMVTTRRATVTAEMVTRDLVVNQETVIPATATAEMAMVSVRWVAPPTLEEAADLEATPSAELEEPMELGVRFILPNARWGTTMVAARSPFRRAVRIQTVSIWRAT